MAGPFHHDVGGDAHGQGVDDEGAAAGMGTDRFPLRLDLVGAYVALVGGDADFLIDTGQTAELFDVAVHRLVGIVRQGLGDLVQFDGNAVCRLDGRDLDVVALDIAAAEVVDVGVPKTGEAAEEEDVPDGIQVGLGLGEFQVADAGDLILGQVNDLALCHLERRAEFLIGQVGVVAPVGCPVQEPARYRGLLAQVWYFPWDLLRKTGVRAFQWRRSSPFFHTCAQRS